VNIDKKKSLGFWMCVSLVLGNMIGSGIFLLPASLAEYGGISILGWVFTAVGALFVALVFVRLSRRHPALGGPYAYTRDGLGRFPGFLVGWCYSLSLWCGNAAIAVAMVSYASVFFPVLNEQANLGLLIALSAVWLLTLVNCKGVKEAGYLQVLMTVLKTIPLIIIAVAVVFYFDAGQFTPLNKSNDGHFSAVTATAALTLWAFLGLESATVPADNVENPSKTIPKATIVGFLIAALIYIASTVTILSIIPHDQLVNSSAPFADAARIIGGDTAYYLIAATALVSCFGALNGWILMQGQIPMALANDELFPKIFKANDRGVPVKGLLITSVFVSLFTSMNYQGSLTKLFTFSILVSTLALLVPYLFSIFAELRYIHQNKSQTSMFAWFTPIFALCYVLWAISGIGQKALVLGLGLVLLGIPTYFLLKRN